MVRHIRSQEEQLLRCDEASRRLGRLVEKQIVIMDLKGKPCSICFKLAITRLVCAPNRPFDDARHGGSARVQARHQHRSGSNANMLALHFSLRNSNRTTTLSDSANSSSSTVSQFGSLTWSRIGFRVLQLRGSFAASGRSSVL